MNGRTHGDAGHERDRGLADWGRGEVTTTGWDGGRAWFEARDEDYRGLGPKGYRRSDERIREEVVERLTEDRYVDASDVEVSVSGAEVRLNGTVRSRPERRRAEEVVEAISGVEHVQNDLRIARRE